MKIYIVCRIIKSYSPNPDNIFVDFATTDKKEACKFRDYKNKNRTNCFTSKRVVRGIELNQPIQEEK